MQHKFITIVGLFSLIVAFLSCQDKLVSSTNIAPDNLTQQIPINLEDLDEKASLQQWLDFFAAQGIYNLGMQLKKVANKNSENALNFSYPFKQLHIVSVAVPDQTNQAAAGMLQYLSYHGKKLKSLSISGNVRGNKRFSTLPTTIGNLVNLTKLDLRKHKLEVLPKEIGHLNKLVELKLSKNQLYTLPSTIGNLKELQLFYINNNRLNELPQEIGNLTKLMHFNLDNNQLDKLPPQIVKLTNLVYLWVGDNALTKLPPQLADLTNLRLLDLSNNQLTILPSSIAIYSYEDTWGIALDGNPWLQPEQLNNPIDSPTLAAYAYQAIPRTLVSICGRKLQQAINPRLPEELQPLRLTERINQACELVEGKRVITFRKINDRLIPFYSDQLYTKQAITNMLKELEGKQIYLWPAH